MRPSLRSLSLALASAFLVLHPRAAGAAEPSPDASERSSILYKEARALQIRAKWAEAEAKYQAAWDLRRTFDIAGNLGDCEMHVGQPREAAEHLGYALKNAPAGILPEQSEALKRMLKEAKAQVGTLHVTVNVRGAEVLVDGKPVEDPAEVYVDPGPRTVEARLAGYEPATQGLSVRPGAAEQIALVLHAPQERGFRPPLGLTLGAAALAVGGLAAGIGLTVAANGKRHDADAFRSQLVSTGVSCANSPSGAVLAECQGLQNDANSRDALSRGAVAGYVIGGTFALAAAALGWRTAVVAKDERNRTGVHLVPAVGAGSGALFLTGTW